MKRTMVVVEDDQSIREMLRYYFSSVGFEVSTFESGEDYFESKQERPPSIFILDIMLPNMDGFEILKRLRGSRETAETPVILLTARSSEVDRVKGLETGGDDYVVKPFGIMELQARVNAVMRRSRDKQDEIVYQDLVICAESRQAALAGEPLELTYKEFELLLLLLRNRGRVLSREEILSSVWDYNYVGETRTVDMHIKSLRSKLFDTAREPKYIVTVRGAGYMVN